MVTGAARVAQQTDPRKVRVKHAHKDAWSEVWENNPRIARREERGDFQILYARSLATNMRPYHLAKSLQKWSYDLTFRPEIGELYFSAAERDFGERFTPQVIVEPNIKPSASPNKQWGFERWERFAGLAAGAGIELTQLGPPGARRLRGAAFIETPTFRSAAAVLSRARGFVGGEGGMHHAAAALNVPGVVIFGGFTPVELTGYPMHRNLGVSLGDACGMRTPCPHCAAEMAKIEPEFVLQNLMEILACATS